MKEIKINDAIIGLNQFDDPVFGSISYHKPINPNTIVTIRANNTTIQTPVNQIRLAIFKLDAETFGFIFKNKLFWDKKDFSQWNKDTRRLASHELERNL